MVSTRNHTSNFPPPSDSPSKSLGRSTPDGDSPSPATAMKPKPRGRPKLSSSGTSDVWTHTPSNLTLIWLAISLPLVAWDTGYVLLRPYSMPGGSFHWPIWVPYELYGRIDYIYGFKALEAKNGFTAAQGMLNLIESLGYMAYLWIVLSYGSQAGNVEGTGAPSRKSVGWIGAARSVGGSEAGVAVLIAFATAVMTLSKTVLYCKYPHKAVGSQIGKSIADVFLP